MQLSQADSCKRLKILAVVFVRKTKCLENTNKEMSAVNVLQWLQERVHQALCGFARLHICTNKDAISLTLSVLGYKPYAADHLELTLGLNDIQKTVCALSDRGIHRTASFVLNVT